MSPDELLDLISRFRREGAASDELLNESTDVMTMLAWMTWLGILLVIFTSSRHGIACPIQLAAKYFGGILNSAVAL